LVTAADVAKSMAWVQAGPLLYRGRIRAYLITEIIGALGLGVGSVLAIPHFGLIGVGYAYVASCCIGAAMSALVLNRACNVPIDIRGLLKIYGWTLLSLYVQAATHRHSWVRWLIAALAAYLLWRGGLVHSSLARARRVLARLRSSRSR
jgi:O-antigen/teichoic acid export membrane protein